MSLVHVVRFGAGTARRFLAQADAGGCAERGWRPFVWTKGYGRAEKFSSPAKARAFALDALGHSLFDIGVVPPCGRPTDNNGGTPAAIRLAA